jgi:8-oxo-dGTP pyrophosphatase MutT (NUDIX family)
MGSAVELWVVDERVRAVASRESVEFVRREHDAEAGEFDASDDGWTAAGAVVWNPRGEAAFVETEWSDGWVLPGGGIEKGETPAEAARREVREETGIDPALVGPRRVEEQVFRAGDASVRGWFVVFAARTDATAFGSDLGEHAGEIERAGWFGAAPANTESFVDAEAVLAACRLSE